MLLPLLGIELRFFGNPVHSPLDKLTVLSRLPVGYAFIGMKWHSCRNLSNVLQIKIK
jgi:hypothetical protein